RLRIVLLGALVVVIVLGAFVAWLATGLLSASRTVQADAAEAQGQLQQFRDTLKLGDQDAARKHLAAGKNALRQAQAAARREPVRMAGALPWVGSTVSDLDHLLAAAGIMTSSADDALSVYGDFAGKDSKLFRNNTFSLPAIHRAQASVADIKVAMDRAARELAAVKGDGPKGAQVLEKKQSALRQVAALRAELVSLGPLLQVLPSAVGANGRRTYLVTILNPAESRASGGAPLSVAFMRFDRGRMTTPLKGQTSDLTHQNAKQVSTALRGDPWVPAGTAPRRFVNTTFNPDFRMAAAQMAAATKANFGYRADGVIALDVVAIAELLRATGPIQSPTYGTLTADNVAQKLVVDAYQHQGSSATGRHDTNDELMTVMLSRLTEGGGMIGKARALGKAVPGRHLQMWFADKRLQGLVESERAAGAIASPRQGDLAAAYTQNGNGSKVDVFQHRTVKEVVRLRADGSATVRRTVVIENRTPPYQGVGPDPRIGYDTRWATLKVINLMPPGARVTRTPALQNRNWSQTGVDQEHRTFASAIVEIAPGGTATLIWEYVVPRAAVRDGNGLRLLVYAETQSLLNPPSLQLTVVAPRGWKARPGPGGWRATSRGATIQVPVARARLLQLKVGR
ncbi:MAG TPA: DUF4012 domain-containing protein, partial [Candidatus Eisenbacteria bacterium]|nr:DUF4012 domain-containing protein [Candidatus Eisenbacteria bacterium]